MLFKNYSKNQINSLILKFDLLFERLPDNNVHSWLGSRSIICFYYMLPPAITVWINSVLRLRAIVTITSLLVVVASALLPPRIAREDRRLHVEKPSECIHKCAINEPNQELGANETQKQHNVNQKAYFHFI